MTREEFLQPKQHNPDYVLGLSHGLDIAMGFAEWIMTNAMQENNVWWHYDKFYTTAELLQIYLTEINKK